MDFSERLDKAVQRGQKRGQARDAAAKAKALSVEELRRLHNDQRLAISDHIERCLSALANRFPGFDKETIYGDAGWGTAVRRDDAGQRAGSGRSNFYSRLEMTVRPISPAFVVEITAKGTIRNKEVFNRKHFEKIAEADLDTFRELIDVWVLEYAELFAASG
jgi:hypothetical protein